MANFLLSSIKETPRHINARYKEQCEGFSLLELVAVISVLSILAGFTVPAIFNRAAESNVDEAKALLNAAAADCLQKGRLNSEDKDKIDPGILSNTKLKSIGFAIDEGADKCSYLQISPTNKDDSIRFPVGFSVAKGALAKFATPTSTNPSSISACEQWAGTSCKQDESLKKWIIKLKEIEEAKNKCVQNFETWISTGKADGGNSRWNSNADSNCPSRPPTNQSFTSTCTPNGCNSPVFAFEGKIVGTTQEDYDRALDEKYGQLCKQWAENQRQTDNPLSTPVTSEYCGGTKFWFCSGTAYSSMDEMNECIMKKENARITAENLKCEKELDERNKSGISGPFKPNGSTIGCQEVYFCFKDNVCGKNPCEGGKSEYDQKCYNNAPPPPPVTTPPANSICSILPWAC